MCDTLHLPARLVLRLRGDVASASELRERIAPAEECEECLSGLLPNNLTPFDTTRSS